MGFRFEIADEEYIEELIDKSENEHTRKSTEYSPEERFQKAGEWKKLTSKFRRVRQQCHRPNTVAVLYLVVKRKRGWSWVRLPESNASITGKISKMKSLSRVHHPEKSWKGRPGNCESRAKGSYQTRGLTKEEDEVLWQNGQLGGGTPGALLNTMWWLLTQHFGLRGRQEHNQMKVKDFTLRRDDEGNEF